MWCFFYGGFLSDDLGREREREARLAGQADRIDQVIEMVGGTIRAAELVGANRGTLRKWKRGEARLPLDEASVLAAAAGVSVDWIATGIETASEVSVLIPRFAPDASGGPARQPFDSDTLIVHRDFFPLQRLEPTQTGVVRVMGDAMAPSLAEGALVVIDMRSKMIQDEGLYVIGQPGRAIVRRAAFAGELMRLVASNPAIADIDVPPEQTLKLKIWGRVVLTVTRA